VATVFKPETPFIAVFIGDGIARARQYPPSTSQNLIGVEALATEAGRAFIDHGFNQLGLDRIASTEVGHAASIRVLKKLAFRLDSAGLR
jgi:hypothetical protein